MRKFLNLRCTPSWLVLICSAMLASCSQLSSVTRVDSQFLTPNDVRQDTLSSASIRLNASSPALDVKRALVITDNNQAFSEKIRLIQQAKKSIDLAYYIYKDDYSSSVFSQALLDAANRGVKVRLLLDYQSTYNDLDLFSMLERYGNQGKGSLQVRFYNRPTVNIIKDAMYLTLDCGEVTEASSLRACNKAKYTEIESRFSADTDSDKATNDLALLNKNSGGSGLFLSAFYANNIQLMALAIKQGQDLDKLIPKNDETTSPNNKLDAATLDKLVGLGKVYVKARHGKGLEKLAAKLKLKLAFALFGGEINPYYDAFTAFFPIGRDSPRTVSLRDWNYVKDFYHQKLLLVDNTQLLLGGRNIEDAYHMLPNKLSEHYVFLDTDVMLELQAADNSLQTSFDKLWGFRQMVATIEDIRQHAPNDFLMATVQSKKGCEKVVESQKSSCEEKLFAKHFDQQFRLQQAYNTLQKNRKIYNHSYHPHYKTKRESNRPQFSLDLTADPQAEVYYVENLPFTRSKNSPSVRQYGADNGKEGQSGKYIHNLWMAALRNTCKQATAESPQGVIMHNAYVFFPSNLLHQLAEMTTGVQDCRHVSITVLTNSIDTTDLGIENYAARYSMKAFYQHLKNHQSKYPADLEKAAKFAYYEYKTAIDKVPSDKQTKKDTIVRSLHSKVMVFGNDLFIGSANADVRSYMMDANNGLYFRQTPHLISEYKKWFRSILSDSQHSTNITKQLEQQSLQQMLATDVPKLEATLLSFSSKLPGESTLNPAIKSQLSKQLKAALESIFKLNLQSLGDPHEDSHDDLKPYEAGEKFNEWFKLI